MRGESTLFAIAPGHEITDIEDVLERHQRYFLIRKRPESMGMVEEVGPAELSLTI